MSETFTKCISRLLLVLFFILAGHTGFAQYIKSTLETGYYYTGVARDESGNLYALRLNTSAAPSYKYDVVKYFGATTSTQVLYSGLELESGVAPYGIAVNSLGDVYVTSNSTANGWEVVKLTWPTYSATKILAGKYVSALAFDHNDNLLTLEYNGNSTDSRYIVKKRLAGSENSAGTTIYAPGLPMTGSVRFPTGLAVDSRNNIYFTDFLESGGGRITKLRAPWYTSDTTIADQRSFVALAVDDYDRIYGIEATSSTASSIIRFADSSFNSATTIYNGLHNGSGAYPGGVVAMTSGQIFATDGTDAELVRLLPITAQIMKVDGLTANPTASNTISFEVEYSGNVTGVGTGSFALTTTGVTGASVNSVTGSGNSYTVVVNTGTGSGTIKLIANAPGISPTVDNAPKESVVYTIDKDVPTATIAINGGATATNNVNVVLTLTAADATSGVSQMRFSVDGGAYTAFEPFATTKNIAIPATEGNHTIAMSVTDKAGNATIVSSVIRYDITPPATPIFTSTPAAVTTSASATFSFTVSAEATPTYELSLDGAPYGVVASPLTLTGLADGTHTVNLRVIDRAGNISVTPASHTWTIDATAPQITSVGVPANGYYKAGQPLAFRVKYNEVVNVTTLAGTPYINIVIGLTTVQVPYTSGTGTDELTFTYVVQAGENDNNGIVVNPLVQNNSGLIRDAAGNNASTTLNNVATTTGVLVNTNIPSVTLSTTASAVVNTPYTVTATFSEAVTGLALGDFTMTNGTLSNLTTSDNITYTVTVTPTANGTVSILLPAATVQNIGANTNTASNTLTRTYDNVAPTVTSVSVPADAYYKAGGTLAFTVTFSENIVLNATGGTPYITLTLGSSTVNASYSGTSGTNGLIFAYTVVNGDQDMDGITVGTLNLNGATIRDAATNNANLTLNSIGSTTNVRVNTTSATVVLSTTSTNVNAAYTLTATFSEAVTGLSTGDFIVTNGTLSGLATSDNITYTATITPTAQGAVTVQLPANAAVNIGNNGTQASNTLSVTYDATAPTVTTVTVPANGYYRAAQNLEFTVNFSEPITLNTTGGTPYINVTIGATTVQATYNRTFGTNGLVFRYTIVDGDNDVDGIAIGALSLNGATIRDAATNNANITLNSVGVTTGVFVNTVHPTVTITSAAPSPTNTPFTVTITFSEAVTGLAVSDFSISNATVSNLQTSDNITYTALITPAINGNFTLSLPANETVNIAANGNQASNNFSFTYDATAPVVTAVSVPANGYYNAGQTLNLSVTFNENIAINTTGGTPSLGLTIGATPVAATYTGTNGTTGLNFSYIVLDGQQDMDGIVVGTLTLNGATIKDAATNNANLTLNSVGNTANVRVNTTHPTVTLSTAAASPTNAPFTATITFSEAVTGFATGDFIATNATVSNLQTTDNITYTVLVTPTANGAVSLTVPANTTLNIGNNGNAASNTLSLTYDATAPTVTTVTVPADGYYKAGDVLNFTVRFSENISLNTTGGNPYITLTIGAATVNATYTGTAGTDGLNFSYTVVDGNQDMDGITVGTLTLNGATIRDAATNNANLTLNGVGNTANVKVNTTSPVVTLTSAAIVNAPFTVTATFSEAVTGLIAGDFTVTNGTVSNLVTSDNITYTVTVTPTAEGAVTVLLPAAAAVNIGNNPTVASNTLSVDYDVTVPTVTSVIVPANGYYRAAQNLDFLVNFSENITLNTTGGTPYISVTIGTATVQAAYNSTFGTKGVIFRYTVQDGDNDLDGIAVGAMTLNGATIRDAAANNANITLNGIGATTNVFVNTIHPTVAITTAAPAKTNAAFTATVTFSEAVTGLLAGDFNTTNATLSNLQTTDNITYTVLVTPAADGPVSLSLPVDQATNIAANGNQASNTLTLTYDATAPVVTSVAVPANGYYKAGQTLNFTVNFGEDIVLNTTGGNPSLSLTIGAATVTAAYTGTNGTTGLNFSYTVVNGDTDADGITVGTLSLNGSTIRDVATNNADITLNSIGTTSNVFVNTTHPTVTLSTAAPSLTNAPFTATITFSEAVTGFATGDFTATNAIVSNLQTTDNITYTVLVTPTADGAVSLTIPADAAVNIGDNGNTASNTISLTYDGTAPVVASVTVPANGYYKAADVLNFTVQFSENITLNTTGGNPYLTLTIGTATVNATYTGTAGTDGLNFSYTVVDGDDDMDGITVGTLTLNGATIKDAATNDATLTLNNVGNTTNVKVNTSGAAVTLSSTATLVNAPFTVTAIFSEAVTGLATGDFNVTNGTVSNLQTTDNITYTVTVTPGTDGTVSVELPVGAAVNIGNNPTLASNTLTVTNDATDPVVTSVTVPANGYYKSGDVLNFTLNFSEDITPNTTGGIPYLNVTLSTGTVRAAYTSTTANAVSFSYIVRPGDMDLDGITLGSLNLNAGTFKDVATNDVNLTLNNIGNTTGVLVHTASPSVQLSTTAPSRVNAPFTVTAAFNEAVNGLTTDDFTITNGTVGSLQTTDNITYTVVVTPAADGVVTIQLPTGKVVNVVGYVNTASNVLSLTYDATAPVVTAGQTFEILERSAVGTLVGNVTATEVAGTLQDWAIATDDSNGAFEIDANGTITVKDQAKLNAKANSTVTMTITVSDGLNTSAATPVTVTVLPVNLAPSLDPISNETICPDGQVHTINLNGASAGEPAQTFSFAITTDKPANFDQLSVSSTTGQVTYQLKPTATGTATVTVTIQDNGGTANGGVDTLRRSFTITVATLGQVDITSDKGATVSKGDVVHLTATGGTIYKWDDATGIISGQNSAALEVRPMENTTYHVTVSNAAGCSNTAEFTLSVVEDFKVEATNLLTPNGDGINDKWVIRNLDSYPDNELKIYDRAGRLVYTRRNYSNDWDGTLNGSPLGEGTYYYILTIQGGAKTAKGYITIVRDRR
jgi:large repetitive protein